MNYLTTEHQMDDSTSEVAEILDFKVTETSLVQDGQVINYHFNIRNKDGEIVSRDYDSIKEPVALLRDLVNYINATANQ